MLPEERKAIARRAHDAINQKNLALLDDHPGYWQTRQIFPLLFTSFPDATSTIEQQTVEGAWVTTDRSSSCLRVVHRVWMLAHDVHRRSIWSGFKRVTFYERIHPKSSRLSPVGPSAGLLFLR